jgi:regulator of CtrA degradation
MQGSSGNVATVNFFTRFTSSEQFEKVFREGPGRLDARVLERHGAIAYATESMRLTTRLMQLASWLLLQRAIGGGELTVEDARKETHRISLNDIGKGHDLAGANDLPDALKALVERSLTLHQRIQKLDSMISAQTSTAQMPSPVNDQIDRLASMLKVARG